MNKTATAKLLTDHCRDYPQLQIQDIFKFLHQSTFGCEHLISSPETALQRIREEFEAMPVRETPPVEPLDGAYARVHLNCLNSGLKAETLAKLFFLSAKTEEQGRSSLLKKLQTAKALIADGALPFSPDDFQKEAAVWEDAGFPAMRHSEIFRTAYCPAYRVIALEYIPFLPLLAEIDRRLACAPLKLAVEGGSASGKTTLSRLLEAIYGCTVFHMDDFFLRPEQRTPQRFSEPGGNVDRERFLEEVLVPLRAGNAVTYRPFDCSSMALAEAVTVYPGKLTVVEGAYSMHPDLRSHYDLSVFLDVDPELQKQRILHRNGEALAARFFSEWIPLEQRYFSAFRIPEVCHLRISVSE